MGYRECGRRIRKQCEICDKRTDEIVKNRVWWDLLLVVRLVGTKKRGVKLQPRGLKPEKGDGWRERDIHLWHWRRLC